MDSDSRRPQDRTPISTKRRFQFGLRTLLILMLILAPGLLVLKHRLVGQSPELRVRLSPRRTLLIERREVLLSAAGPLLKAERQRRLGLKNAPTLVIEADANVRFDDVQQVLDIAQQAGFEKLSLSAPP